MAIIYVMSYDELAMEWPHYLPTCVEKGYPEIVEEGLSYWVMVSYDSEPLAYTCSKDMGEWIFVGNTYVREEYRGQNIHRLLISYRNSALDGRAKVAILNPLVETKLEHLKSLVSSLGYNQITSPEGVEDIMDETTCWNLECPGTSLWRLG